MVTYALSIDDNSESGSSFKLVLHHDMTKGVNSLYPISTPDVVSSTGTGYCMIEVVSSLEKLLRSFSL